MDIFIAGLLCLVLGFILGASTLNNSESKKAKEGGYTVFDGKCYKYVEVRED